VTITSDAFLLDGILTTIDDVPWPERISPTVVVQLSVSGLSWDPPVMEAISPTESPMFTVDRIGIISIKGQKQSQIHIPLTMLTVSDLVFEIGFPFRLACTVMV
jgi:hypothetical protein